MTDVAQSPDTHHAPDRTDRLKDPVLTVRQLARFQYALRRPDARIDHALVFVTAKGKYDAFVPPQRPTRGDITRKRYIALYEVDMGLHSIRLALSLPSAVDAFHFETTADLTWQVTDPEQAIISGVRDVPALLEPRLGRVLREACRRHRIDAVPDAEKDVQHAFDSAPPLAEAEGLRVGCTVRLLTDVGERTHSERLRKARHEAIASAPEHGVLMEKSRRTLEEEEYARKILAEKIAFYQDHLSSGGIAPLVLHLAAHPEDTKVVLENIRDDQKALLTTQLELVDKVLDQAALEGYQLEKPKDYVVETMTRVLGQSSPPSSPPPSTDTAAKSLLPPSGTNTDTEGRR
ncbi:hypothetical protein ACIO1C_18335 [Streptomyces sp. NPDC087420]|uniref:hypothetical protein n=1 Tax=Streptomyces sp. NPDC087420 TaxID=3365785 RepID=UPI003833CD96